MEKINLPFGATPINMENNSINIDQGGPELPTGSVTVPEPPGPEVKEATTSGTGVLKSPNKRKRPTCRVGNSKEKWSHEENVFLWECYETSCHPTRKGYMKRMHEKWSEAGMRDVNSQRLATQVQNIEKKAVLSKVERQRIHNKVTGNQDEHLEEEDDTLNTMVSGTNSIAADSLDDSVVTSQLRNEVLEVIDELEESYEEGYEFFGFEEDNPEDRENSEILKRIEEVMIKCKEGKV